MEEMLTVQAVADVLNVHYNTVFTLIRTGKLKASKIGVQYRIKPEDLKEYIKNMEV